MYLTDNEKKMLNGDMGKAVRKSMELLIAVGECFNAQRMTRVTSAHLVAATPTTAGKGGVKFIKDMKENGGRFSVPVTTNPNCIEPWQWKEMGFPEDLYKANKDLTETLVQMGAYSTQTCTPYLIGHSPSYSQSIAWGESSAIVYSNTVLGARTNREGGPTAIASAITGLTPEYGLHLNEGRKAKIKIIIEAKLKDEYEYALAGYYVGKVAEDRVPIITGIPVTVKKDELKCFGAAAAVSGSVALFHIPGVTPEATVSKELINTKIRQSDTYCIGSAEIEEIKNITSHETVDKADLIILGCPHASIYQLKEYSLFLDGKKVKSGINFWILSSHVVKKYAEDLGYLEIFEKSGVKIVSNTCPASMPQNYFNKKGFGCVATNSPKQAYYASTRQGIKACCVSLESILEHSLVRC